MNPSPAQKPRVAFLGLGVMGEGMARRLLGAGFPLTVYNRSPAKAQALAKLGAVAAASPREAVASAAVILAMVSDDPASRELWLGPQGALAGAARGTVAIESSTITVGWIQELGKTAAQAGVDFLDAPVTGSKPQAQAGELRFLVGGSAAVLDRVRPVLAAMSKEIVHLGPLGSGGRMKLINNFMVGVQVAAMAEAMAVIERSGLDRAQALDILTNGAPGSPMIKTMAGRMTAREFVPPNFMLRLMTKDLGYASLEGQTHGVPMAVATAAAGVFKNGIAGGWGDQDISALVEQFRAKP